MSSLIIPSNSVCTVAIHFAPPSSLPRAAVGYSPTSFFALSPLLIDRSRRKTLHTLHPLLYFPAKQGSNTLNVGNQQSAEANKTRLHSALSVVAKQIRTWKSCSSTSGRSGTVVISELLTLQSGNGTRDCKPALQLTDDISNMHFEHDATTTTTTV